MKLQIDTTVKTIKVEGTVSLLELTETLERLLPNGIWKTFSLECGVTIVWNTPTIIRYPNYPYYPWWYQPAVTYSGGFVGTTAPVTTDTFTLTNENGVQATYNLVAGTYNVEI